MKDHRGCAATLGGGIEPPIMAGVRSKSSASLIPFAPEAIRQASNRAHNGATQRKMAAKAGAKNRGGTLGSALIVEAGMGD